MTQLSKTDSSSPKRSDNCDVFINEDGTQTNCLLSSKLIYGPQCKMQSQSSVFDYIFLMISSSNFFKKTFFTIQPQQKVQKPKNEPYGPWSQQIDQVLLYKSRRSATKQRYIHKQNSSLERQNEQELTSIPQISKSLLLAGEQSIVQKVSRGKSLKQRKNKFIHEKHEKIQTKLPAIKINDSQNQSLRKSIIKLQGGLLNFITSNHHKSLKKFVSKREQSGPKFEMYKKCLIAARRMMQEGQYNTLFYNS